MYSEISSPYLTSLLLRSKGLVFYNVLVKTLGVFPTLKLHTLKLQIEIHLRKHVSF